jgi:hypothetical protein
MVSVEPLKMRLKYRRIAYPSKTLIIQRGKPSIRLKLSPDLRLDEEFWPSSTVRLRDAAGKLAKRDFRWHCRTAIRGETAINPYLSLR